MITIIIIIIIIVIIVIIITIIIILFSLLLILSLLFLKGCVYIMSDCRYRFCIYTVMLTSCFDSQCRCNINEVFYIILGITYAKNRYI